MSGITFSRLLDRRALPSTAGPRFPIARVEWFPFHFQTPNAKDHRRVVCRITTSDGAHGVALMPLPELPDAAARLDALADTLRGRNALEVGRIWDDLYARPTPLPLLSALDVALWDLYGRLENKPVHALLGSRRDRVPAYVSTQFNLGTPEEYGQAALACRDAGFPGFKIHPTHNEFWDERRGGDPEVDVAICRAVRQAVGPGYNLMLDPYLTYDYDQALRVGRVMDELAYRWYESPMPEDADWIDRYVRLRAEIATPLCAPECQPGSYDMRLPWIRAGACDICRIDIYMGGLTPCLRLARACDEAGLPLELHTPGEFYHLQIIAATPPRSIEYLELFTTARDAGPLPGVLSPKPVADAQGCVPIPDAPGMGLEPDWPWIEAHRL